MAARFPDHPVPMARASTTVELRGQSDLCRNLGGRDAQPMLSRADLESGGVPLVRATTAGVFYARSATRIAEVGKRIGKIAGDRPFRDGPLLSP